MVIRIHAFDIRHGIHSGVIERNKPLTVLIKPDAIDKSSDPAAAPGQSEAAVEIEDDFTIVVGSLFEEVMVESAWKVPLLGDLPVLGFVFRNQGEEPRKSEIITFITVKVVDKE